MDKYDRQIRLWSKSGQKALSKAHILVIGVRTATTEMVKSLALSGVGHITLLDNRAVSQADILSNFFVLPADLGKNIALSAAINLRELNPDITIDTVESADPAHYDLVVVANGCINTLESIYAKGIDVIEVSSRGFYGRVRSFYRQFASYETHPPNLIDLRFGKSVWPELQSYLDSIDLEGLEPYDLQAVPFTTILGKIKEVPTSFADKKVLKQQLMAKEGDNWRKAAQNIYRLWAPVLPDSLTSLFTQVDANLGTTPFWSLVAGLRDFCHLHGAPPVSGVLPDMATDTKNYIIVQQVYREKAEADRTEFAGLLQKYPTTGIDDEMVRAFCKNARHLLVINGQSPLANTAAILDTSEGDAEDPEEAKRVHFRDVFEALELTCNGPDSWAPDATTAARIGDSLTHKNQLILNEMTRSGGGELTSIAGIIGGIAAQEVTKLILRHYSPLAHTLVYDGTSSDSAVF